MNRKIFLSIGVSIAVMGTKRPSQAAEPNPPSKCESNGETQSGHDAYLRNFSQLSDTEVVSGLVKFYPNITQLAGEVNASPEGLAQPGEGKTFYSEKFFGAKHAEFDRTVQGVLVLKWFLAGDRESLIAPQKEGSLSPETFAEMRDYLSRYPEHLDLMITGMIYNDLGKVQSFIEKAKAHGIDDVDHDKILAGYIEKYHAEEASLKRFTGAQREMLLRSISLGARVNLAQVLQLEVPDLEEMPESLPPELFHFFVTHFLADMGGAAGHVQPLGSPVVGEAFVKSFQKLVRICEIQHRFGPAEYREFLRSTAQGYGLLQAGDTAIQPDLWALTRIAKMLRLTKPAEVLELRQLIETLPKNVQLILQNEFSRVISLEATSPALLFYYAPALLVNAKGAAQAPGLQQALTALAHIAMNARVAIAKAPNSFRGRRLVTIFMVEVAALAKTPNALAAKDFSIVAKGNDFEVTPIDPKAPVDLSALKMLPALNDIPGRRILFVGLGGGSDVIQAAQLAKLLSPSKEIAGLLSVRTKQSGSIDPQGREGQDRSIEKPLAILSESLSEVGVESQGSGRFVEHIPAADFRSFLHVNFHGATGELFAADLARLQESLGFDTIVAVDSGGDLLDSRTDTWANLGQHQDQRVVRYLLSYARQLSQNAPAIYLAVMAPGVDAPDGAAKLLEGAKAQRWDFSAAEREQMLGTYRDWHFDGSDPTRYGLTAFAFQSALHGNFGMQDVGLPPVAVLHKRNPWNTFARIHSEMNSILFMKATDFMLGIGELNPALLPVEDWLVDYLKNSRITWREPTLSDMQDWAPGDVLMTKYSAYNTPSLKVVEAVEKDGHEVRLSVRLIKPISDHSFEATQRRDRFNVSLGGPGTRIGRVVGNYSRGQPQLEVEPLTKPLKVGDVFGLIEEGTGDFIVVREENEKGIFWARALNSTGTLKESKPAIAISRKRGDAHYLAYFVHKENTLDDLGPARAHLLEYIASINENIAIHSLLQTAEFRSSRWFLSELTVVLAQRDVPREYAMLSSGHGSAYRFSSEKDYREDAIYSLLEAELEVWHWESYADTIGGRGIVVHVPTWKGDQSQLPFVSTGSSDWLDPAILKKDAEN